MINCKELNKSVKSIPILVVGVIVLCLAYSCKKDDSKSLPAKSNLLFPRNNELCTESAVLSDLQSKIVFKWEDTGNTDSYDLILKDLESGTESTRSSDVNSLEVILNRGTGYSWYVVSKSTKNNKSTKSDVWKFYNPGAAVTSYSPFPADLIAPSYSEIIPAPQSVTLKWSSVDLDNDIDSYDIYLGLVQNPPLFKAKVAESTFSDIKLDRGKTYFWKVVTLDKKGNRSHSDVYMFRLE